MFFLRNSIITLFLCVLMVPAVYADEFGCVIDYKKIDSFIDSKAEGIKVIQPVKLYEPRTIGKKVKPGFIEHIISLDDGVKVSFQRGGCIGYGYVMRFDNVKAIFEEEDGEDDGDREDDKKNVKKGDVSEESDKRGGDDKDEKYSKDDEGEGEANKDSEEDDSGINLIMKRASSIVGRVPLKDKEAFAKDWQKMKNYVESRVDGKSYEYNDERGYLVTIPYITKDCPIKKNKATCGVLLGEDFFQVYNTYFP